MSSRLQLQNFLNVVHLNETRICGRIFSKTSWKSENVEIRTESGSWKLTFSWVIRYSSVKILYLAEFIKFFHFVIEINFFLYNFFLTSIEFKRFSDFEACILKIVADMRDQPLTNNLTPRELSWRSPMITKPEWIWIFRCSTAVNSRDFFQRLPPLKIGSKLKMCT